MPDDSVNESQEQQSAPRGGVGLEKTSANTDQSGSGGNAAAAAAMPDFMKQKPGNPPKIAAQLREK